MSTNGENEARDALKQSVEKNRNEVRLAAETMLVLRGEIRDEISLRMPEAVADGIQRVLTTENAERLFNTFFEVMHKKTREGAGDLAIGGIKSVAKWGGLALMGVGVIFYFGGWAGLKLAWSFATRGAP